MSTAISALHWVAGFITLAEALNKLDRTCPLQYGLTLPERLIESLKALAWGLLAVGGAGAVVTPVLVLERPTLQDACTMAGFAVLIIRTRVKERCSPK